MMMIMLQPTRGILKNPENLKETELECVSVFEKEVQQKFVYMELLDLRTASRSHLSVLPSSPLPPSSYAPPQNQQRVYHFHPVLFGCNLYLFDDCTRR